MPVGVYRKKGKNGSWMHFRDGKLISKKSYDMSKARTTSRPKRAKSRSNKLKGSNRKMTKRTIPHPSVTGMASGLAIASYLNQGPIVSTGMGGISARADGVIKDVADGELGKAFSTLSSNAIKMIGSDTGRKTLVGASLVAMAGAFARKQFPNLKLGGSKLYFRV